MSSTSRGIARMRLTHR